MPVVAVIGASSDRRKFGNRALRAFQRQGYTVVPINPNEAIIEGQRAYARVGEYPGVIDQATSSAAARGRRHHGRAGRQGREGSVTESGRRRRRGLCARLELGLKTVVACSILAIGEDPSR